MISVVSLAACFLRDVDRGLARGVKLFQPVFEERLKCLRKYGKESDAMPVRGSLFFYSDSGVPILALPE